MNATATGLRKMTAERLAQVESLQMLLRNAAELAANLSEEEQNGWEPGTPQTEMQRRARPLEDLSKRLGRDTEELEALYS